MIYLKTKENQSIMNPVNIMWVLTRIEPMALSVNIQQKLPPLWFELKGFKWNASATHSTMVATIALPYINLCLDLY